MQTCKDRVAWKSSGVNFQQLLSLMSDPYFEGLGSLVTITKEDVARQLPTLVKSIEDACHNWSREDGVIALLCIEDAYDDLLNAIASDIPLMPRDSRQEIENVAIVRYLAYRGILIDIALDMILRSGDSRPASMQQHPSLEISLGPDRDTILNGLASRGQLMSSDAILGGELRLMGKFETTIVFRIVEGNGTREEQVIREMLDLLGLISKCFILSTAVRVGTTLAQLPDEKIPRVNYPPSFTPEYIMAEEGVGPRTFFRSSPSAADWSTEYERAVAENIPVLDLGLGSHTGRAAMDREKKEFVKAFESLPGFDDLFKREYGFSLRSFHQVTNALDSMAVPRLPHHIYRGRYKKIVTEVSRKSGVPEYSVKRVLSSVIWTKDLPARYFPLLPLHTGYVFSLIRIGDAFRSRIEGCFQSYDNSLKGEAFENACRNLLSTNGFNVHPSRLAVNEQVLSDADSHRIWGRIKKGTDFDVLGSRARYLVLLECKERKASTARKTRQRNLFYRYLEELYLKTLWLVRNMQKLEGSPCLKNAGGGTPSFLLPLFVYNIVIREFDPLPLFLTFKEFRYFLENFDMASVPRKMAFLKSRSAQTENLTSYAFLYPSLISFHRSKPRDGEPKTCGSSPDLDATQGMPYTVS